MTQAKPLLALFLIALAAIFIATSVSAASLKSIKPEVTPKDSIESDQQDEAHVDEDESDEMLLKESSPLKTTSAGSDLDLVKGIVDRGRVEEKPAKLVAPPTIKSSGSNINNAKTRYSAKDIDTAAGHHHHYKHSVSGWLDMGAHSGMKGSFGWHDKHPVGGKGRR